MTPLWKRRRQPHVSSARHRPRHGTPPSNETRKLKSQVERLKERLAGSKKFQQLKERHLALLIEAIKVSQSPVNIKFDYRSTDAVLSFLEKISDLALKKEINERLLGALNGAIAQAIHILQPSQGVTVTVSQQMGDTWQASAQKALEQTPEKDREVIARFIRNMEQTEASSSKS